MPLKRSALKNEATYQKLITRIGSADDLPRYWLGNFVHPPQIFLQEVGKQCKIGVKEGLVSKVSNILEIQNTFVNGQWCGHVPTNLVQLDPCNSETLTKCPTNAPLGKWARKMCSVINNSAADCWSSLKFGTWMRYESPEATELWKSTSDQSRQPTIFNLYIAITPLWIPRFCWYSVHGCNTDREAVFNSPITKPKVGVGPKFFNL